MLEGDWLEQERSGGDVGREPTKDDSHVTVRLHYPLAKPHAVPGVRGEVTFIITKSIIVIIIIINIIIIIIPNIKIISIIIIIIVIIIIITIIIITIIIIIIFITIIFEIIIPIFNCCKIISNDVVCQ